MAAKILPKSPPGESKKTTKLSPAADGAEDKRQSELVDALSHLKDELGDVKSTLKGIARASILLEKLSESREGLYQAVNAHSSLIDSTVDWLDRLRDEVKDIMKLPGHLADCARGLHCMHDSKTVTGHLLGCWCGILKRKRHGQPATQPNDAAHGRRRSTAEKGGAR